MIPLLKIQGLSAFYGRAQSLHDINLAVAQRSIIGVVGANGAGKSTLLDAIMGLVLSTGSIQFEGNEIINSGTSGIVRRGIAYAPERGHLFPHMSVADNLRVGGFTVPERINANLQRVYALFPKLRARAHQQCATQSGGERQMVSLGRALMSSPRLVLIDEPTIGLAPAVCKAIEESLRLLSAQHDVTIIITEQNVSFALSLASYVHVLDSGRIVASGLPEQLAADDALNRAYFGR